MNKMRRGYSEGFNLIVISAVVALGLSVQAAGAGAGMLPPEAKALVRKYYKKKNTCRNAEAFVRHQVDLWWNNNDNNGGKGKNITPLLLKMLYADCMVNGCDGSILLDGADTEKNASQNAGLGKQGFILIDKIKTVLEARCPGVVSCADILNLAVRDAVHLAGAPSYPVLLGRRDGVESNAASVDLPQPSASFDEALAYFISKGLSDIDYATLLGAHTMGKAHCRYIGDRLYNFQNTGKPDPSLSRTLLQKLRRQCPKTASNNTRNDPTVFLTNKNGNAYKFTNTYYTNVLSYNSVLKVDQDLLFNYNTSQLVLEYAGYFEQFRRRFALSITRMGGLGVLTGTKGEIRRNCRVINKNNPKLV